MSEMDDFYEYSSGDGEEGYDGKSDEVRRQEARDVVDTFLSIVEQYERNKDNCTPGTEFNLGEGVVAQYGVLRYKAQAMVAVNRANFLTRIWKISQQELLDSEPFFYAAVREMVDGDPQLFGAGNCYDYMEYKDYTLWCPYAYRMPNASEEIMVKDLSTEYKYLKNSSEWFYQARLKAKRKLLEDYNETKGTLLFVFSHIYMECVETLYCIKLDNFMLLKSINTDRNLIFGISEICCFICDLTEVIQIWIIFTAYDVQFF